MQNDACPLENDGESLVMVIGGETVVSRENEHSTSVEIVGPNGLCKVAATFLCLLSQYRGQRLYSDSSWSDYRLQ